jgi:hypothetical protein
MGRPADRGVTARAEQTLVTVVPADAITPVWQLAHHLENLADPLRFTHAMARDHHEVSDFGCVCSSVHDILPWV